MQNKKEEWGKENRGRERKKREWKQLLPAPSLYSCLIATDLAPGCSLDSFQWGVAINKKDQESAMKVNVKLFLSQSDYLRPHGLYNPWNSPGQNTGVGSLYLLQGIFPKQELNPALPHYRQVLSQLSCKGSPRKWYGCSKWWLNVRITSW